MSDLTVIVLAAGEGTRMKSSRPKLLHPVAGRPIISHVIGAAKGAGATALAVITGPGDDGLRAIVAASAPDAQFFEQNEQLGTAHAAQMAEALWSKATGNVAIVYGDHPLLRPENFQLVLERLNQGCDAAILGFEPDDATGYGRFITEGDRLLEIREHKDASDEERKIGLCNACILVFTADLFRKVISLVENDNAQKEYYMGDLVIHANRLGHKVGYAIASTNDVMGVNSQAQRAEADLIFQNRLRAYMMDQGVMLEDPASTYFSYDTKIGRDVTIEPNVYFGPAVEIANGARIRAFSHIEGASIGANAEVGPFARLRPGTKLGEGAKAGNFVEVKNANIGKGAKLSHLSYIGDADIGAGANIGAGTITCNYDGINKHRTIVGEGVFIGSNSALVAPVEVGNKAFVASGSVITEDVPANALALGRARQTNKDDYATILRNKAEAQKNKSKN